MRFLTTLLTYFIFGALFAQTPGLIHYDVLKGLSSNLIYSISQDEAGYMWFGSDQGLTRFDGTHFKHFEDVDELPKKDIFDVFSDQKGRLWVAGFEEQIGFGKEGRFYGPKNEALLSSFPLKSGSCFKFQQDKADNLWVTGATRGFIKIKNNQRTYFKTEMVVGEILDFDNRLMAIGSSTIGEISLNGQIKPLFEFDHTKVRNFLSVAVFGNRILATFQEGVLLLEFKNNQFNVIAQTDEYTGIPFVDAAGKFWISNKEKGAICLSNSNHDLTNPVFYLKGRKVCRMFQDRQKNLWFATMDAGIFMLPAQSVLFWGQNDGLLRENVQSMAVSSNQSIYLGDDIGNIMAVEADKIEKYANVNFNKGLNLVRQIIPVSDNRLFVAADNGFHLISGKNNYKTFWADHKNSLGAGKAITVKNNELYGGSHIKTFVVTKNDRAETYANGRVTTLFTDPSDVVWKGSTNGIFSSVDSFKTNYALQFPILNTRISGLSTVGNGTLLAITPTAGLLKNDIRAGKILSTEPVFAINQRLRAYKAEIASMFVEQDSTIWLATNRGVFSFQFSEKTTHIFRFSKENGLPSNDINAVLIVGDTIWAATANGICRFLRPKSTEQDANFTTIITQLTYATKEGTQKIDFVGLKDFTKNVLLPNDASLINFDFAGLDLYFGGEMRFEVHLSETKLPWKWMTWSNLFSGILKNQQLLDTTFLETGALNLGIRMTPSSYQIRVTAIRIGDVRSAYPDELNFILKPLWYQTIWFWLAIASLFLYGLWRLVQWRFRFSKLTEEAAIMQLHAVRAQMNPHFIGNSINAIQQFFYPPNPEKASEYISLFTGLLRKTLLFSEKDFITFQEESNYIREYLDMVQLRFGNRFQFEILGTEKINPETKFPTMLLQPILENATIHGLAQEGDSELLVEFFKKNDQLVCQITDNGVGIRRSVEQKKVLGRVHPSRGIHLLEQKIRTLNRIYKMNFQLEINDLSLSKTIKNTHGTQVILVFKPK
jgi:ligand-binding sensor domain-containing protein